MINVKQETILKKAESIKKVQQKKIDKTKQKIDKIVDVPDVEYDEEETIITKKPKKKELLIVKRVIVKKRLLLKKHQNLNLLVKYRCSNFFKI